MLALAIISFAVSVCDAKTITFADRTWTVRPSGDGDPGPKGYINHWSENNAWVDSSGQLHLKISKANGKWYCAEIFSNEKLGFGQYQWYVIGRLDKLHPNVVLGLFPYLGPDERNEIDIEMSKWGKVNNNMGKFTVWPAKTGLSRNGHSFSFTLNGDNTTLRFNWQRTSIFFQMLNGHRTDNNYEIAKGKWNYSPVKYLDYIPQRPMPVRMNLWLFKGAPPCDVPSDCKEVEIIIKRF